MNPNPMTTLDQEKNEKPNPPWKRSFWGMLALMCAPFVLGRLIPPFYDWTGSNQGRSPPVVGWTFFTLLVGNVLFVGVLLWFHFAKAPSARPKRKQHRWTIRSIFVVMTVCAVFLATGLSWNWEIATLGLYWLVVFQAFLFSSVPRWHTMILLACQLGPFAWLLNAELMHRASWKMFVYAPSLAALLPVGLLSSHFQKHIEQLTWLGLLLATLELSAGIGLFQFGFKRGVAWCVLVLTASLVSSFALNALMRA